MFGGASVILPWWLLQLTIPSAVWEDSFSPHPLQCFLFVEFFFFFDDGLSEQCEVTFHCSFDLYISKFHWQRSLGGYSPWGCKESDTTERLHSLNEQWRWAAFPVLVVTEPWFEFPESHSKCPLDICFTHDNVCFRVILCTLPSFTFPPPWQQVCPLCVCLHWCPANRFISAIFIDSLYALIRNICTSLLGGFILAF